MDNAKLKFMGKAVKLSTAHNIPLNEVHKLIDEVYKYGVDSGYQKGYDHGYDDGTCTTEAFYAGQLEAGW